MPALTPNQYGPLALFMESAAWGIQMTTFVLCLRALLWTKDGMKSMKEVHRGMLFVTLLMPILASGDVALNLLREIHVAAPVPDPDDAFGSVAEVFRFITLKFQTLTGDAMLVYRCWVVYGKAFRAIALSALLWLAAAGSALTIIVYVGILPGTLTDPAPKFNSAMLVFWCTSISLNIVTTGLIVWRIYRIERKRSQLSIETLTTADGRSSSSLSRAIRILVESGALYTCTAIVTLATFASNSVGVYVTSAVEPQIVGITFNLIIIRVHNNSESMYAATTQAPSSHAVPLRFIPRDQRTHSPKSPELDVGISVSREVNYDAADKDRYSVRTMPRGSYDGSFGK